MNRSVAAIIVCSGKVLVAQRKPGGAIGGRWEFPGGKMNDAETADQALRRELREELGVDCRVGERIAEATFANGPVRYQLAAFLVRLESERFILREHIQTRWVPWKRLALMDLPPSDRSLLPQLLSRFTSPGPDASGTGARSRFPAE